MTDQRQNVQDLQHGTQVCEVYLIGACQQLQAKNGPYWRLEFRDATGSIGAKIWSPQSAQYPDLLPGQIVDVRGRIISYRDIPEMAIDSLRLLSDEEKSALDLTLFMKASPIAPQTMLEELEALCKKEFTHKPWKKFARLVLTHEGIRAGLFTAPAAKGMHHAYAGGLLEHTLSVCKSCLLLAKHYPHIDKQLLFAGALCHDLGKIWEMKSGLTIEYTQAGQLLGHISLIMEELLPLFGKAALEPELVEHLQHLIISHHGKLEFGAARLPATAEAFVLHYADDLDAKLNQIAHSFTDIEDGESGWSAYCAPLGRSLFKALPTPASTPADFTKAENAATPTTPTTSLISLCSLLSKE